MRGAIVALAALLSSCTVGPDYGRPPVETPAAYRFSQATAQAVADTGWWQGFDDPVLSSLVDEALRNNLDVQIAAARVDAFLGAYVTTRSALFPQVAISPAFPVQAARQRGSRISTPQVVPGSVSTEYSTYQAGLTASWEIDLWGKVRRRTEAARADVSYCRWRRMRQPGMWLCAISIAGCRSRTRPSVRASIRSSCSASASPAASSRNSSSHK